jgi:hypothetical protein
MKYSVLSIHIPPDFLYLDESSWFLSFPSDGMALLNTLCRADELVIIFLRFCLSEILYFSVTLEG